jgi:DNA methylase
LTPVVHLHCPLPHHFLRILVLPDPKKNRLTDELCLRRFDTNNWVDLRWGFDAGEKRYVVETNPGIIARCILMTTDPGDLVLDPTCGSGTTAYVAEQWGSALDHMRHEPRRAGAGSDTPNGS